MWGKKCAGTLIIYTNSSETGQNFTLCHQERPDSIPGRNIATNLHTLNDIVKYANSKNVEAAILFLDQEKAFNRVDHQFLLKTLKHLNFGDNSISWIEIILKDISSQIKINGFLSDDILIAWGVRQGDPLSALLYVIIAEVLGNLIRSNKDINGITINSIEQKILQYADDTQIIVTNDKSINDVFQQLRLNEDATGVNVQKTEGLFIGKWKNRHDKSFDCEWTNDKVFTLGLGIGNKDTSEIIFTEQLAKIKSIGSFWKPRKLSLIGRVHVVNIFLLSRLWYRTEIFSIPTHILHELESFILDFVLAGKKHEVNKQLMSANLDQGGLKLVNIQNKITSQRIVWLLKLCSMKQACFTRVVAEEQIGHFEAGYHGLDFLKTNSDCFPIHSNDKFYEEVIKASNKVNIEYILMEEEQLMEEHIFGSPRILDSSGKSYKIIKELASIDIFRVRDLSFKPGRKHYNKVFNSIKKLRNIYLSYQAN